MDIKLIEKFVLLVLYGIMEDGYLTYSSEPFITLDETLIKTFKGNKEAIKDYFEVNYHKIFKQENKFQSIYVLDTTGNTKFLKKEKREYLEKMIRDLLINIFSSLYTITQYYEYTEEFEILNREKLFLLLKSFGLYDKFLELPITIQRRFMAILVRAYKRKGTFYVYNAIKNILGLNFDMSEIYAYVPFDNTSEEIEFEYFDEELNQWIRLENAKLYEKDVRAYVEKEWFLR